MNILLTSSCSRRCPYCFAQERVELQDGTPVRRVAPKHISVEDFGTAIAFALTGHVKEVGILGGEPSLHPHFLNLLEHAWDAGLHTKIFTNGMWRPRDLTALAAKESSDNSRKPFHVVLNVNEPDRTPENEQRAQSRLLEALAPRCTLSFNISHLDFDPMFLVDVIRQHGTRRNIRLGVAQPLAQMNNEHIPVDAYKHMTPTLMRLATACDEHDIQLGFDCGFLLCMFDPQQHGELALAGTHFRAGCGPTVDIGTDLSAWACFPLSTFSNGVMIEDFENLGALVRHFDQQFKRLYRTGALPDCVECRYRRRGQCAGGCAAHVFRAVSDA